MFKKSEEVADLEYKLKRKEDYNLALTKRIDDLKTDYIIPRLEEEIKQDRYSIRVGSFYERGVTKTPPSPSSRSGIYYNPSPDTFSTVFYSVDEREINRSKTAIEHRSIAKFKTRDEAKSFIRGLEKNN